MTWKVVGVDKNGNDYVDTFPTEEDAEKFIDDLAQLWEAEGMLRNPHNTFSIREVVHKVKPMVPQGVPGKCGSCNRRGYHPSQKSEQTWCNRYNKWCQNALGRCSFDYPW